MKKEDFIQFAKDVTESDVRVVLQIKDGKWYEQEYTKDFNTIEPQQKYGICIDGTTIDFDFKTGKNVDSFFKSFVSQYISKFMMKQLIFDKITNDLRNKTREECYTELKANERVFNSGYYTTLYGIGVFIFIMSEIQFRNHLEKMKIFLNDKNIDFKTEMSEAGWVLRFKFNKSILEINQILKEYKDII